MQLFLLYSLGMGRSWAGGGYEKVTEHQLFNGDKIQEFKLPNGFRVLLVPRHQAKVLTYQVWFNVGSIDEKMDQKLKKTGLAHLFEHMMFRGSEKYPDGQFDFMTAKIGSDHQNATTYYYRTNYYESVPSVQLETLMELESDRMENLKLNSELIEKEKGAVVGELRKLNDSPRRLARDEVLSLAYEKLPYRWTVIGTEEEIKGFTLEEAQYFYKTFYAPNNATLIVIGDATEQTLMPLVVKYYGAMKPQTLPKRTLPKEPVQAKLRKKVVTHKQATSEILQMAYKISGVDSTDIPALSMISTHLSQGMEARLRKSLVDTGLAVGAMGDVSSQPDLFEIVALLAEGKKASQALKVIEKEVDMLTKKPLSQEDFERAQNQELLSLYSGMGDNSSMGTWLGEYLVLSGNYLRGIEIIDAIKKLKVSDIQKVAKKYFNPKNLTVVEVHPERKG
jgi:predicted Zn-dependent peptidase